MRTPKHTPGPWVVDETISEDNAGQLTLGIYADGPETFGYIAGIHCGPDAEITNADHANAALIAAAPAMYEALNALVEVFPSVVKMTPYGVTMDISKIHDDAKAALAQAEGTL